MSTEPLDAVLLDAQNPGWRFEVFDEVGSTSTMARERADQGAAEKTLIIARAQTAGRGRFTRVFESAADKGVWMTMILRPKCPPDEAVLFTILTAVALNAAFEQLCGMRADIKWINDLQFDSKKVVGILTEGVTDSETGFLRHLLIGVGINLSHQAADFSPAIAETATSLWMATGKTVSRQAVITAFLRQFERWYADGIITDQTALLAAYRRDLCVLGCDLEAIRANGERFSARALDIDGKGGLLIELPDGRREILNSGEISIRKK